jgi:hypothetical protein
MLEGWKRYITSDGSSMLLLMVFVVVGQASGSSGVNYTMIGYTMIGGGTTHILIFFQLDQLGRRSFLVMLIVRWSMMTMIIIANGRFFFSVSNGDGKLVHVLRSSTHRGLRGQIHPVNQPFYTGYTVVDFVIGVRRLWVMMMVVHCWKGG